MQLYRGNGHTFAADLEAGNLEDQLVSAFQGQIYKLPSPPEVRSWHNSLPAVATQLRAADLMGIELLLEYTLPLTSRRIDVLLIGRHPATGQISVVVWENKQWTVGEIESVEDRIVSVTGRLLLHPQQQVHQYVEYLSDFNQLVANGSLVVNGLTYLHNATEADIGGLRSAALADVAKYPMFSADREGELRAHLKGCLSDEGASNAADEFLMAPIRPSKKLLDHVSEQMQGNDAFTLLDEQLVAYEIVRSAVNESRRSNTKKVIIVKGGPGSGKSVIATNVLGDLSKKGYNVSYACGSRSFTTTLQDRVGSKAGNLFRYTHHFAQVEPNDLDVLITDEAHRIRESSNTRFTPKNRRSGTPQVDELVRAARVPLFLLDEHQVVRPDEIGTIDAIMSSARRNGAEVINIDLDDHFRCGGSEAYLRWVEHLLGLEGHGSLEWDRDDSFELLLADTPAEAEEWLRKKHLEKWTARLTAGFCWPWSEPVNGSLVNDVVIGNWRRPWNLRPNLKSGKRVSGIPSASLWASDPAGFNQVGCIYSAQGFEYDYAGVIIGPDLVWSPEGWRTDPSKSCDSVIKRAPNFDSLVKHVYRVLLTRGLRGCVLTSVDADTSAMLATSGIPRVSSIFGRSGPDRD